MFQRKIKQTIVYLGIMVMGLLASTLTLIAQKMLLVNAR